ncbi:SLC13 family permease [Campylobacter sp. MIT 21-1685]|uniref:SLC13 family permease n=1 Tax=unclassified Campylobacter TaxID=2593542 RepID=UPI00224A9D12|nr:MULTISPECIES: SLC13 family permease [unclassified Campylobacter]MCX2683114.1 SLC13 family permease [Campylobacter sp. MIT 21-1684]MCX2751426.1 SLC13 family permease [Campylobacter sp. MIT 21-1682]MCX2807626.1 SLC13 family permease [Campylobacter sp. MIT 21-1685]
MNETDRNENQVKNTQNDTKTRAIFLGLGLAILLQICSTLLVYFYLNASLKVSVLTGATVLLITLWTNKALPMGVVSLLPIILFPVFGILDTKSATSNYANPINFLFLGGFMIATATEKIGLHHIIARIFLARFEQSPKGVISALGFAAIALGTALSNSTVTLLLLPVALSITDSPFLKTRFLLAVAFGSSISGITTPIGSPPNLIYLGFLESIGLERINFITWVLMMLPVTLLMFYMMVSILSYGTKGYELKPNIDNDISITKEHKRLLVILATLLITLLLNSPIQPFYSGLGLNENLVLLAFGLTMFMPKIGFLDWSDSKSIPYELIFLFGASFCIAMAFSQAELGGAFEKFFKLFNSLPFIVFIFLVCCWAIVATGFLSTTALIAIVLPIINVATSSFLDDTQRMLTMLIVTICASFSFMIPISTPPNAIVFSQGGIKTWDMIRFGFLLSLAGIVLITLFGISYWRIFL